MTGEVASIPSNFVRSDTHFRIGFRYWKNPGPIVQYNDIPGATGRFVAWWSAVCQAAFAFIGTEVVAVSTANTVVSRHGIDLGGNGLDHGWRGEESSPQHPKGYSRSFYPYPSVSDILPQFCSVLIVTPGSILAVSL